MIPLTLYIHFPWCAKRCPYCDFNAHTQPDTVPQEKYIAALLKDFDADAAWIQERPIEAIFMGGGTPSLFDAHWLNILLKELRKRCKFPSDIEITIEANPGRVDCEKLDGYFQAGINRLSLGIQSFNDDALQRLGRIHSADHAHKAISAARNAGFQNINLDLMFGLPEQTLEQALFDVQTALDHQPEHLSWYQLTLEPNTPFYRHPPVLPQDDCIAEMQQQGGELLIKNNFHPYEVSAFSQLNRRCKHNMNYWQFGDYLGIGAGAHSKITLFNRPHPTSPLPGGVFTIIRCQKTRMPKDYLAAAETQSFRAKTESIDENDIIFEFMLNALRLHQGFNLDLFESRTGLSKTLLEKPLKEALRKKLIIHEKNQLTPTALGRLFLNNLVEFFYDFFSKGIKPQ